MPEIKASPLASRILGDQIAARLLGSGLSALTIKVASAVCSYFMLIVFARMLVPKDYGQFGIIFNVAIVLSSVAALGLPTGVMRFWPAHHAKGELDLAKGYHSGAQKILFAVSLLTCGFGVLASWFNVGTDYLGLRLGALLVAVFASVLAFAEYYANALRSQNKIIWSMAPRDVVWRVFSPLVAAMVFWITGSLTTVAAISCCIAVITLIVVAQALVSRNAEKALHQAVKARTDWPHWRRSLVPLACASILFAMVQQLDVVVIGAYLGAEEAGAYFAAQKTASLLGLVMIAGGLVAAPMMSAAFHAGKHAELQRICKLLALAIAMSTSIGFVVLVMLGKPLLVIFNPSYESAYPLLVLLALGFAIDALAGPTAYLMQMTSLEGAYLRIMAVVYAFVLALQVYFVPKYGAIAAAAATASGVALWNLIAIYQLRRSIGIDSSILSFFLPPRQT
jgi:O-antigen/teichoic acid export membrane protein